MNQTADFDAAFKMNVLVGIFILALFLATAILSTIPGFLDMVFSALGGK